MTDQQIRLYALARTVVPPEFRIRSFREDWPEIFARVGIKVPTTSCEIFFDEHLLSFLSDSTVRTHLALQFHRTRYEDYLLNYLGR